MPHINICILAGHMTRDVELRYTTSGTPIGEFGLAINRKWKSDSGEMKEEVSFFDCVAFGRTAENINEYFRKGSAIMLEGRLKQESWEDKQDGRKRSKVKVIVEKFHFTASKAQGGDDERPAPRRAAGTAPPAEAPAGGGDEDNVPF
jgi:single-strand DNA-binding protein